MLDLYSRPAGSKALRTAGMTLWIAGALTSSSCFFGKKAPRIFHPPAVIARAPAPAPPAVPQLPPAPELDLDVTIANEPELRAGLPELPEFAAPRTPRVPAPAAPKTAASAPTVETPTTTAPKLAQIFTPEERRRNTQELEDSLNRVKRALGSVAGKNLTAEQNEIVDRIRTFLLQAEQAREQDLVTAVNLAKRADVLAKDLLERLP